MAENSSSSRLCFAWPRGEEDAQPTWLRPVPKFSALFRLAASSRVPARPTWSWGLFIRAPRLCFAWSPLTGTANVAGESRHQALSSLCFRMAVSALVGGGEPTWLETDFLRSLALFRMAPSSLLFWVVVLVLLLYLWQVGVLLCIFSVPVSVFFSPSALV